MKKEFRNCHIVMMGWMLEDLQLKGNELIVYAIIYGFSQTEGNYFTGSASYLAKWTGATKRTIFNTLASLVDKGYILRQDRMINGNNFPIYEVNPSYLPGENFSPLEKEFPTPSEKISAAGENISMGKEKISPNNTNNKSIDNTNNNISYDYVVKFYNENCKSLPSCQKLTDKRRKAINACYKMFSDRIYEAMGRAEGSDWLCGRTNKSKWTANFDWIFNTNNMVKILEGNYDNKATTNSNGFSRVTTFDDMEESSEGLF